MVCPIPSITRSSPQDKAFTQLAMSGSVGREAARPATRNSGCVRPRVAQGRMAPAGGAFVNVRVRVSTDSNVGKATY